MQGVISKLDDMLNPILVKELRQSTNGNFFRFTLIGLTMLILVSISLSIVWNNNSGLARLKWGKEIFDTIHGMLTFCVYLLVPLWICCKFTVERANNTMELLYASTIIPPQLILGKYLMSIVIAVQLYSICVPFMAICYLLRGVDVFTITVAVIRSFILFLPISQAALFVGAISVSIYVKYMFNILFAGAIFIYWAVCEGTKFDMTSYTNLSSLLYSGAITLFFSLIFTGFFFLMAVATIQPKTTKRIINKSSNQVRRSHESACT